VSRGRALALVVTAIGLAIWSALTLRLGTDLTNFMPVGGRSDLAAVVGRLTDSPFTRTMVLSVEAPETGTAVAAAAELTSMLRDHPEIGWVRSALDETDLEDVYALYFPRRHYFLSDEPEREIPLLLSEASLREKARTLRHRLATPASSFLERLAAADPLAAFQGILERLRAGEATLRIEAGQLVTADGRFAIVLAGTAASAFDSGAQSRLLDDLDAAWREIVRRHGPGLRLEWAGANRFAVAAERSMKRDVYLIAVCSFLGVAALFLAFVASLRGFLLVALPPLAGILVATAAGVAVFGNLDGLTMAFGASLMGIAIDYSNHLLIHHGLARPEESAAATARRIRPSLSLGALTTVASFGGLAVTAFPAFREMAFFAGAGVVAALLTTLFVLPDLLEAAPPLPARSAAAARRLDGLLDAVARLPRALLLAPLAAGALAVTVLPRLEWSDDMSRLTRFDPEFVAEDRRVRARVSQHDESRFVIGLAPDPGDALALNDRVHARLERARANGALAGARSLHALLWSEDLQRRNQALLVADVDLYPRLDAVFASEGFRPGAFGAFEAALAVEPPPPLSLDDLRASPLSDLLAPYVFPLGDRTAVVTYLRDLREPEVVRAGLADLEGVHLLDQRTFVNDVYREFRQTTLRQMLVGGLLVVLLLALRYRAWRPVLASALPSALVALIVLAVLAAAREPVNLLHVMSLIMVTGMGVDYGVFLVDASGRREAIGATMLSLLISCLTTALVFGTLAFSSQPALRAIGVTTGLGILLSYAFAPVTLVAAGLGGGGSGRHASAKASKTPLPGS
jgi:predicted exporter